MPVLISQEPLASLLSAFGLVVPACRTAEAGRRREEGEIRRALTVNRPVQCVFPVFARYTTWPEFMRHLYQVEELGFGLSRWKAAGPGGLSVTWYARVTRFIPNELIAWQSESGSTFPISGSVRFEPANAQRTRVLVRLSYRLPGGRLGRFVAWLFGTDLESALDEELQRVKQMIESEQPAARAEPARPVLAD
jgi:uncharacterized membrane protein